MAVIRARPMKTYRVLKPHGAYCKGAIIQPTGMYRDLLLKKGVIAEIKDTDEDAVTLTNRMIDTKHAIFRRDVKGARR